MSTITALTPWFGSKRTIAPAIVEALGRHSVYWEPFCWSMAVLMAKAPCKTEVVNDLHGDMVNLARVIQHPMLGPALYRRLRRVLSSQALFGDSLRICRESERWEPSEGPDLDRAFHYFVVAWQGMNGVAGTRFYSTNYCRRFSSTGGDAGTRWAGAVRSIPAWRRRMEKVQILQSDALELLARIDDADSVAIYCDPPYLVKGAKYLHDFDAADHQRLADALRRFRRSRVVVSYYEDPRLDVLYPGWPRRTIEVNKAMVNSRNGAATRGLEVLITNLPWPDDRGGRLMFD